MAGREVRSVNKKLTEDERQRHRRIREQIEQERPELVAYGKKVKARHDTLRQAVAALKAAREALGLTLTDIRARTGIEKSNLSRLENDPNPNPTIDTPCRYADAVGKEIAITLVEKSEMEASENKSNLT
jgi:DNA-binding XRE family transcriptional regulator